MQEQQSDEYSVYSYCLQHAKGHAIRDGRDFEIDKYILHDQFIAQSGCCNLSGVPLVFGKTRLQQNKGGNTASIDRVDSRLGYLRDNIQWLHKKVNVDLKKDKSDDELIWWARRIAEHTKDRIIEFRPEWLDKTGSTSYNMPISVDEDAYDVVPF